MYQSDQPESKLSGRVRELESELEKLNNVLNQISHLSSNTEARVIKNGHRKKNPYKTINSNGIINYSLN